MTLNMTGNAELGILRQYFHVINKYYVKKCSTSNVLNRYATSIVADKC